MECDFWTFNPRTFGLKKYAFPRNQSKSNCPGLPLLSSVLTATYELDGFLSAGFEGSGEIPWSLLTKIKRFKTSWNKSEPISGLRFVNTFDCLHGFLMEIYDDLEHTVPSKNNVYRNMDTILFVFVLFILLSKCNLFWWVRRPGSYGLEQEHWKVQNLPF